MLFVRLCLLQYLMQQIAMFHSAVLMKCMQEEEVQIGLTCSHWLGVTTESMGQALAFTSHNAQVHSIKQLHSLKLELMKAVDCLVAFITLAAIASQVPV